MQDECIALRFKESQRESIKRWINMRYHFLWATAEWPWKRVGPVDLSVLTGDTTPVLPTGFTRPYKVFNDFGQPLDWLSPDDFDDRYMEVLANGTTNRPDAFKWVNNTITLGPTPDADYTFKLSYERSMTFMFNGVSEASGDMVNPNDEPIWDEAFHYVLVPGAIATGLRLENDPTFQPLEEEFAVHVQAMKDHYLPTQSPQGNLQYGRDEFGLD